MKSNIALIVLISLIAVSIVGIASAEIISHYYSQTTTINVIQPISVTGTEDQEYFCFAGDSCVGEEIVISNIAPFDKQVRVFSDNNELEIPVRYAAFDGSDYTIINSTSNNIVLTITSNSNYSIYPIIYPDTDYITSTAKVTTEVNPI